MVKVRDDQPVHQDGTVDLGEWLSRLQTRFAVADTDQLQRACLLCQRAAGEVDRQVDPAWPTGPGCFRTGLEMVEILAELKLDTNSLVAAVLYRAVREEKLSIDTVSEQFDATVVRLISGVQGMAAISTLLNPARTQVLNQSQDQLEKVRKMLVSIIDDVRVALLKLAERTCAIRAARDLDRDKRQRVAREVFEIYAPLAHRLGIGYIKWELEDLSFRYLNPQDYKRIAKLLDEKRQARQEYIDHSAEQLRYALKMAEIDADVHGRAKHIYSIWRKMKRKGLDFRELYDIRAFRIITRRVRDCYAALGVVHSLYNHIPQEFDDYIATPKENGYRSLHTAVFGPEGKTLEVQIRTEQMHEESELGVCAHWRYKGTDIKGNSDSYEEKLNWLRNVLEWHEELGDLNDLAQQWRTDVQPDRIYVFTKAGHVVDMATGTTPIDFAFRIHTEVGLKCRGAKVGGRIVPLNHRLKTGDQVEILTASSAQPSRDWMNSDLGYVTSSRAKAKITGWFRRQDRASNTIDGRLQLDSELKRLAINKRDLQKLVDHSPYGELDDLYAAIGAGDYRVSQAVAFLQRCSDQHSQPFDIRVKTQGSQPWNNAVTIEGVGNLLTQMAGCCQPVPGDGIIGYITLGRGVTIHRQDCQNALILQEKESERLISVCWHDGGEEQVYATEILINAYDRSGLLRDITTVLANERVNVINAQTQTCREDNSARILLTVEVRSLRQLSTILSRMGQLANVIDAVRYLGEKK